MQIAPAHAWSAWSAAIVILCLASACGSPPPRPATQPRPAAQAPAATTFSFDEASPGAFPAGFVARSHGPGRPAEWVVVDDPAGGRALMQRDDDDTNHRYNLALAPGSTATDVRVAVRAQAVAGGRDRSFGVVARQRDDSYYLARCNTSDWGSNVRLYRFVQGKRTELGSAEVEARPGVWYDIALEVEGDTLRAIFAGAQVLETRDAVLADGGACGVWTKAESVSRFDDLVVTPLSAPVAP
ncbi:MAG TPA: hypothetical protein VEL07_03290 [Planctomycetota bacterium]|nr:hypothetical protein [Planctomycetota bacterium]